ncbi:MAG: DUF3427 domain-containing protein [Acidimicrobiia bacterium]|nr:DUF3427 domain-containing protein [Acidimicrobiia bacterium]
MTLGASPFRAIPPDEWLAQNRSAFAVADKYPVSPGHALVVPFRQISTWWEASHEEQMDLLLLVDELKQLLDERHDPDGYNVGFNAGPAAGQTVDHLHVHVIPRYEGDVTDPTGGVRNVIPGRGNYLAAEAPLADGSLLHATELFDASHADRRLRLELVTCLRSEHYDRIDVAVSFIMRSGLDLVLDRLDDAVDRGAHVRVLTTDYLDVTDPDALAQLMDLQEASSAAAGSLTAKVWHNPAESFHPKAYLFWSTSGPEARGFVGSSNLSRSGIDGGVEWNLAVRRIEQLRAGFERLWADPRALELDHALLRDYRRRRRPRTPMVLPAHPDDVAEPAPIGELDEPPPQPVAPTEVQREALAALEATRDAGHAAGLVVMATGLGKTWLAAFDSTRPTVGRTLFVAHRDEILRQSMDVFRQVRPDAELGLYAGSDKQPDAEVVFASVQTLHRRLDDFAPDAFDYIVVDEFHHAAAASYRRVIDHFNPRFLLGLTATPERMDGADLLALCGDNVVYECDLVDGIRRGDLVPFRYQGLVDRTDFAPIPWRNGRFDPEALARAVETRERADQALDAWRTYGGGPTLGFCCSVTHAEYMADHFAAAGVRSVAVHSRPGSAARRASVADLREGELDVLFAVDVFNEGVDVPELATVLLLRPTDSPVVFLQQLGRGLRRPRGVTDKDHLRVVDFVGNHRSFLSRPKVLLSLGSRTAPTDADAVDAARLGEFDLPDGCSVAYELAAVDLLAELARTTRRSAADVLVDYCSEYASTHGYRPTAVQASRAGVNVRASLRARRSHWFATLAELELLSDAEATVVERYADVLAGLEIEQVTKSYKLVTLRALLHDGVLRSGCDVAQLAATAHRLVAGDPRLVEDTRQKAMPDPRAAEPGAWERFWRKWPIEHLTSGARALFRLEGDRFEPTFTVADSDGELFDALVAELVEWRLADYLLRQDTPEGGAVRCRVSHSDGRPILFIDRQAHPELPTGWVDVTADSEPVRLKFVKVAVNVAERPGEAGNALPGLLRGWFGPSAGHPGTRHEVELRHGPAGWDLEPVRSTAGRLAELLPLFPSYEVACGAVATPNAVAEAVRLPLQPRSGRQLDADRHFVAFATGDSMDGGPDPVAHGDPLLFAWVRDTSRADLEGERVLVQQRTRGAAAAMLKRLARTAGGWELRSDAAGQPAIAGQADTEVVAQLVGRLDVREISPAAEHIGERFKRREVPGLFDLAYKQGSWGSTGHVSDGRHEVLFVTLDKATMDAGGHYSDHFEGPDRLVWNSQSSTGPESKKGRNVLEAPGNGRLIQLFCRRRKADVAFTYCGVVVPLAHEGSKPMTVTFRLLTPLSAEVQGELLGE